MTEDNLLDNNVDSSLASDNASNNEAMSETMVPQSKVNALIGQAKKKERERAEAEFLAKREAQYQNQNFSQGMQNNQQASFDKESFMKEVLDKLQNQSNEAAAEQYVKQLLTNFDAKLHDGPSRYEDFEKKVADLNIVESAPRVIPLLNALDAEIAPDVMYAIANNPMWALQLDDLSNRMGHQAALTQLKQLADSMRQNRQAPNVRQPNEPLDHLQSSRKSMNSGEMTVDDYRRMPSFRG